jgi:protein TonB
MMPTITLANLAAYSAQVLLLAGAAGALVAMLRVDAPGLRYVLLRATLVACFALPWLQTPREPAPIAGQATATVELAREPASPAPTSLTRSIDWATVVSVVLVTGIALRLLWLGIGLLRLSRLRRAGASADPADHARLQETMGTRADVRYVAGFAQPVTFGVHKPVVLLPESLRTHSRDVRDAVLAHELLHVQRRDWLWVLAEETARAVVWFHPAMWWLISRVQLAREEVVDALAVARTGCRRAYIEALLAFAEDAAAGTAGLKPMPPGVAPAFARRRHLFRRMVLISREDTMTAKRLVLSATAIVALTAVSGWYAVSAFPLVRSGGAQILQKTPGPLESSANPITPENPIPRRVQHQTPDMPTSIAADNAWVTLTFRLTLDATGAVGEARITETRLRLSDGTVNIQDERAKPYYEAAVDAAVSAIERWRYEPPANPPVSFDTTFFFAKDVTETPAALPRGFNRLDDGKALRVGGNVRVPTKVTDARPFYPPDAMAAKVQGIVIMDIRIDEQGRVSDAQILRSIPMLDQAAIDAVKQWEFTPTLLNGVAIPVIATVTINFTLK